MKDQTLARIVYILYFFAFFTGLLAIIGVIIAYVKRNSPDTPLWLRTHFQFQIKTFWYGVAYLLIAILLSIVLIGWLVYIWGIIWLFTRGIKGLIAINHQGMVTGKDGFWGLGEFDTVQVMKD